MIPTIRNIVVGAGSVSGPDPVLEPAMDLAASLGAVLHVVHGYMLTDPLLDAYARAGYLGEHTIANYGRELQEALEAQVAGIGRRPNVHPRAVGGSPVSAILEVCDEVGADLLIVGATRHGHFPLSLLGSTYRAVLRRATVPVLTMRPGVAPVPRRLLAPTDLSEASAAAYRWGLALAGGEQARVEIRALLVVSESLMLMPLEHRLLDRVAEQELEEFARRLPAVGPRVDTAVRKGDPATEIVAEATRWGADLMVLGTHGRKGMERILLGSVAETALRTAPCNVLVVPAAAGENGGKAGTPPKGSGGTDRR